MVAQFYYQHNPPCHFTVISLRPWNIVPTCGHHLSPLNWATKTLNHMFSLYPSVLSDPHSRAIYDIFGKKGLEVEGWEACFLIQSTILVFLLDRFYCFTMCLHRTCFILMMTPCRWWRGRGPQRRFERSMKGYRENEKREDCNKELTPRFNLACPISITTQF